MNAKKRILVAPLNWGLGHATRCIPIIRELEAQGAAVYLASDGRALQLLRQEFPHLPAFSLPAYDIHYGNKSMVWSMAMQLPKIGRAMVAEYFKIQDLIIELQLDGIISDNRYGCFSRKARSIFMTHQLNIQIDWPLLEWSIQFGNQNWIRWLFDECWIPDVAGTPNLSGKLSHGTAMRTLRFVGILSRMQVKEIPKKYDAITVLSGPEPQRTLLEEKIIAQAKKLPYRMLIVGGCPEQQKAYLISESVEYVSFLPSGALNGAMLASEIVISRSGYSTIMDLAKLGKKAILIPTPGQTEQQYLAEHFHQQGIFYTQSQHELDLAQALKNMQQFSGFQQVNWETDSLQSNIAAFLKNL